jgi:hypothetical protein
MMMYYLNIKKKLAFSYLLIYLYYLISIAKFHYEALKTPKEMTAAEYNKLPQKNNWTPEIAKRIGNNSR